MDDVNGVAKVLKNRLVRHVQLAAVDSRQLSAVKQHCLRPWTRKKITVPAYKIRTVFTDLNYTTTSIRAVAKAVAYFANDSVVLKIHVTIEI